MATAMMEYCPDCAAPLTFVNFSGILKKACPECGWGIEDANAIAGGKSDE